MILTDLWLSNYRKHKKLHIRFKSGVTGIVGINGSGKSTIIEAIQFLLTGELFHGSKDEAINLDADTGYVAGAFILNGKKGRLERHLDMSKVVLTYDGVTYKKATEVKELWDKLLQLNPEIIKKVIIARQGHIPDLFDGDTSVREKVWQKIFLVPATDKLRNMIWKDYLKQAPPVVPEEDLLTLKNALERLVNEESALSRELSELPILSEEIINTKRARLAFLTKCIDDRGKIHMLQEGYADQLAVCKAIEAKHKEVTETLSKIDIVKYQRVNTALLQQKGLYVQKCKLEAEKAALVYPTTWDDYIVKRDKSRVLDSDIANLKTLTSIVKNEIENLDRELLDTWNLQEGSVCPTCMQVITDIETHRAGLKKTMEGKAKELTDYSSKLIDKMAEMKVLKEEVNAYERIQAKEQQLEISLNQLGNIQFDQDTLDATTQVIERYKELKDEQSEYEMEALKAKSQAETTRAEFHSLATYDSTFASPEIEREMLAHELTINIEGVRLHQQLSVELKVKQAEVKALKERIANTEINHAKNQARNAYVATLNKAYDVLHTSQFPRKLIMSYADVVTDYLQENISMFDFPYKVRVADDFKIEVKDDQDRVLPAVSGGQQVVIGLSLHLALHDLFSQSFPMMIIDEGTTHLDVNNRKAYFEMIKGLKSKSKLKQILIIDHDPQVADVVDNVITLTKND